MTKIKQIINKSNIETKDYFQVILECTASSCQFGKIREHELNNKIFEERANTHTFVAISLGGGKTTSLVRIPEKNRVFVNNVTFPGLVGTITKDGDFIQGAAIKAAGKVMILDEANRISDNVKDALNNLLEQRPHPRQIGFQVKKIRQEKTSFLQVQR